MKMIVITAFGLLVSSMLKDGHWENDARGISDAC